MLILTIPPILLHRYLPRDNTASHNKEDGYETVPMLEDHRESEDEESGVKLATGRELHESV